MNGPLIPTVYDGKHLDPPRIICCVGYELSKWRSDKLADFVFDLIPEFVLTTEERNLIDPLRPYSTLKRALSRFQSADSEHPRGEVGELLAHHICNREFGTKQFVARLFYKMRSNDQVTGFDMVHLRYLPTVDEIELWLGEAKMHKSLAGAIAKTIKSLEDHVDAGFLKESKYLIGPKLDKRDPHYERLQWIFHEDAPLDEIVNRMIVPIFIASDTKADVEGTLPLNYEAQSRAELEKVVERVSEKFGKTLSLVFIYLPLNTKRMFDVRFFKKTGAFSGI